MKPNETQSRRKDAIKQRIIAFEALFQLTQLSSGDLDGELKPESLHDPTSKFVSAILLIYSL